MKNLQEDYVRFVQVVPTESVWSFTGYTTPKGEIRKAMQGPINGATKPRAFMITFSAKERVYRCGTNQKVWVFDGVEAKQMLLSKYLSESPYCEGSEGTNGKAYFKQVDDVKDAGLLISRKKRVYEAVARALEMKDVEITQIAPLLGITHENVEAQRSFVLQAAESDPEYFFEVIKDPAKEVKSLVRKGIQIGHVKKKGSALMWDGTAYADEDDFISVLLKDKLKLTALESSVKKLK